MKRIEWETMKPEAIEIRPAQIKDGKVTLLAYQNGRTTMDALDRNFGEFGWKMEYKDVGGQIYGRLSVLNEDTGEWIYKEDTGEESNIAAEKGMSTDVLKRCAVRFGYGRELYSIPKMVVDDDGYGNHFKVGEIEWNDDRECTHITLVNKFGKEMYSWTKGEKTIDKSNKPAYIKEERSNIEILKTYCGALKHQEGIDQDELLKFYRFYENRVAEWTNTLKPEVLWNKWLTTKR